MRNIKKKLLSLGLTAAMVASYTPATIFADEVGNQGNIIEVSTYQELKEALGYNKYDAEKGAFVATEGTAKLLTDNGIETEKVRKIKENHPNILDLIENGEIDIVVNTPTKGNDASRDGFKIRRMAIEHSIPVITSIDTLIAITRIEGTNLKIKDLDVITLG